MALPWTKFQDFYLRLGFLKVLVATLDKARVSAANEHIYRCLRTPLFEAAGSFAPSLWESIRHKCDWYMKRRKKGDYSKPTVAEALLVYGDCPSLLFAVTKPTVYKILDWGRDIGFVGRGNQITERGLLLRSLLPLDRTEAFRRGEVTAWNPFVLTERERTFLLYHLCDIDKLTGELIRELGGLHPTAPLELRDAGRVVCRAFHSVLDQAEKEVRPSQLPAFRTARELAATMAVEMEMPELIEDGLGRFKLRPRPRSLMGHPTRRKLTKNTDHQTVPRFEQLTDLGFVKKTGPGFVDAGPRRRWRWIPTETCTRWRRLTKRRRLDNEFLWSAYGNTISKTFASGATTPEIDDLVQFARHAWAAYGVVRRPIGHTPLETVALYAMVEAGAEGTVLELSQVHELMIALKKSGIGANDAFFAGGNALDEMFVRLRAGFLAAVETGAGDLIAARRDVRGAQS